jgi:hypothetical protein
MLMKGRTDQERSDHVEDIATDDAGRPGSGKCQHDGKHGSVQEPTMMEQVLAAENLRPAWRRVKANAGAPGIDGMTVEAFPAFCRKHWPRIRSALMAGRYRPAPVRRVFIPKPDGSQRPLGVPTVLDRVIQQALAQVLTPLFEGGFSAHSYGFREGRNAHQAVREVEACWQEGRRYAVDCDLKSFLDASSYCTPVCCGAGKESRHRLRKLDSQAFSASLLDVNGLQFAALYTLQDGLAADAQSEGGFEHRDVA